MKVLFGMTWRCILKTLLESGRLIEAYNDKQRPRVKTFFFRAEDKKGIDHIYFIQVLNYIKWKIVLRSHWGNLLVSKTIVIIVCFSSSFLPVCIVMWRIKQFLLGLPMINSSLFRSLYKFHEETHFVQKKKSGLALYIDIFE